MAFRRRIGLFRRIAAFNLRFVNNFAVRFKINGVLRGGSFRIVRCFFRNACLRALASAFIYLVAVIGTGGQRENENHKKQNYCNYRIFFHRNTFHADTATVTVSPSIPL